MNINGRTIGPSHPPYVIAELSGNHNGDIARALQLVRIAKESGADAVKFQTYTPDTMTIRSNREYFKVKGGLWDGYTLHDLYQWAHTPWEWHAEMFNAAREAGITAFSTPFDESAVEFLEKLEVPAYKVASFEATDLPLISVIAETRKPLIVSTGMTDLKEIEGIVETVEKYHRNYALLHCVSAYPTPIEESNLRTIPDMKRRFGCQVGLSDHTLGVTTAVTAVALGATLLEKHFTDSRKNKGPDSEFSLEPAELAALCQGTRDAWKALGEVDYERTVSEQKSMIFRRSLFIVKSVKAGEILTPSNLRKIRPGFGMSPAHYFEVLGRKAKKDIEEGTPLSWEMIE